MRGGLRPILSIPTTTKTYISLDSLLIKICIYCKTSTFSAAWSLMSWNKNNTQHTQDSQNLVVCEDLCSIVNCEDLTTVVNCEDLTIIVNFADLLTTVVNCEDLTTTVNFEDLTTVVKCEDLY